MPSKMDKKAQDLHHYLQHSGWLNINSPKYAREGTIIFFGKDDKSIKHVAISIGLGLMIEAGGGGENCITIEDSIKYNAFVRIRPITSRLDFLCVLTPAF
jgi:cell wall-associated NlpC family hydrolase